MIELVIDARRRPLGGFEAGRVLPFARRRMVGPFIFLDHMWPVDISAGIARDVDVLPHPYISLSTLTYLFDGEILHRDSVGSAQPVEPGEVDWMTAGLGITRSERFEHAREGGSLHGIQTWRRSAATPSGRASSTGTSSPRARSASSRSRRTGARNG